MDLYYFTRMPPLVRCIYLANCLIHGLRSYVWTADAGGNGACGEGGWGTCAWGAGSCGAGDGGAAVGAWGAAGAWGAGCRCFIRVRVVLEVEELQVRWGVLHLLQRAVTWCQDSSRSQTRALQCCAGCGAARSQRNPMVPVALGI